jgi:lipid-binding SYLF domain-containing protein
VKLGVQAELSLGPFGRAANIDLNLSSRGAGSTVSVAFSKGVFGALSVEEGGAVGARHATNYTFFSKILNDEADHVYILRGTKTDLIARLHRSVVLASKMQTVIYYKKPKLLLCLGRE